MKTSLFLLSLWFVSAGFAADGISIPQPLPVSDDTLLSAIAQVETGANPLKRGSRGERTQLQIMPATWRQFSRMPHAVSAANPEETYRVAHAYLEVIRNRLKSRGLPETPFFMAAGWNAGPGWKTLPRSTIAYAERVANLAEEGEPKYSFSRQNSLARQ